MIEARIKELDPARRRAVITTEDGREIVLTFPEGANIEIREPTTMGTMGGTLEDLREGYFVEVQLGPDDAGGSCACASLISVS
ncbi:MAG TPA: hypothetical protein VNN77_16170 [candidate division Zixibacteria bacterium]|nr:hypothetical protein [candidate division Zixibacteria bacterium]